MPKFQGAVHLRGLTATGLPGSCLVPCRLALPASTSKPRQTWNSLLLCQGQCHCAGGVAEGMGHIHLRSLPTWPDTPTACLCSSVWELNARYHSRVLVSLNSASGVTLFLLENPQVGSPTVVSLNIHCIYFSLACVCICGWECLRMCVCLCEHRCVHPVWKSEDSLQDLTLIFHNVGPEDHQA